MRIIYTPSVVSDLQVIAQYIAQDSPANAAKVVSRLIARIDGLAETIANHQRIGWSRKRRSAIRMLVEYPYLIYYTTDEKAAICYILAVEHGARKRRVRFE